MDIGDIKYLEAPAKVTLKLSEAIRIGAKIRPQCFGFLFRDGASCALGAAYEAMGGVPVEDRGEPAYSRIYDVLHDRFGSDVCSTVHTKNDEGLSREGIADWLESEGR